MAAGKEGAKVQSEALLVAHNEKRTRPSHSRSEVVGWGSGRLS